MNPKNIAFTSANAWVARALFHSSFWQSFSEWGKATMLVPSAYFPLEELKEIDEPIEEYPQEQRSHSHFATQAWTILHLINGYRLNSITRRMIQNRHIETGNTVGKLLGISQRLAAYSLYGLGLSHQAEQFYWQRLGKMELVSKINDFLKQHCIEALAICGSERDADHPYVASAQKLNLPLVVLVRSWDNLSSKTAAVPFANGYLLWSEEMARELKLIAPWVSDEHIHITGASQFDRHRPEWVPERKLFFEAVGLDPNSSGPFIMYSCGGTHLRSADEHAVRSLAQILREGAFPHGTQILVRLHPFLRQMKYVNSLIESFPRDSRLVLWPPEDKTPEISDHDALIGALAYQDVNVNIASTMSIDSMIFDKPVVNVAFDDGIGLFSVRSVKEFYSFDHYRTIVERGGIDIAHSPEELKKAILVALENPSAKTKERSETVRFHVGQVDGLAGQRTAEAMKKALEARS